MGRRFESVLGHHRFSAAGWVERRKGTCSGGSPPHPAPPWRGQAPANPAPLRHTASPARGGCAGFGGRCRGRGRGWRPPGVHAWPCPVFAHGFLAYPGPASGAACAFTVPRGACGPRSGASPPRGIGATSRVPPSRPAAPDGAGQTAAQASGRRGRARPAGFGPDSRRPGRACARMPPLPAGARPSMTTGGLRGRDRAACGASADRVPLAAARGVQVTAAIAAPRGLNPAVS